MNKKVKNRLVSSQENILSNAQTQESSETSITETKTVVVERKEKKIKKHGILDSLAFTPGQMKRKYEGYGLEWHLRDFFMAYSIAIIVAAVFSYVFSFAPVYIAIAVLISVFFVPIILTAQKKYQYESNRFGDINIYMQQFAQGMIKKKRIIAALEETLPAFSQGEMKDTILEAIDLLYNADNVRDGETAAFQHIEERYGNKQLSTLHNFAMKIEDRGGDFTHEIDLIDSLREKWKIRIDEYQKDLSATTLFCVFEYALILCVCGFIQGHMPESMKITDEPITQAAGLIAYFVMFLFLWTLQKKKCQNWIMFDEAKTNEKTIKELQDSVDNFDPAKKRRNSIKLGVLWAVASVILVINTVSIPIAIFCLIFEILILNMHYIFYEINKLLLKEELKKAFPKWLFDICLLIQKENLTVAITKSIPDAPFVMKKYLNLLIDDLWEAPANYDPLRKFLKDYNIPGVRETMSTLVSINHGNCTDNRSQMESLVKENMSMIDKEDSIAAKMKSAALTRYYYYPMLPCAGLLGCYFFMTIMQIILKIAEVLGI